MRESISGAGPDAQAGFRPGAPPRTRAPARPRARAPRRAPAAPRNDEKPRLFAGGADGIRGEDSAIGGGGFRYGSLMDSIM